MIHFVNIASGVLPGDQILKIWTNGFWVGPTRLSNFSKRLPQRREGFGPRQVTGGFEIFLNKIECWLGIE